VNPATGAAGSVGAPVAAATAGRCGRGVAAWLLACAGLVAAVLVVGGITRLTHSGLSIVHWQPLSGALPPLGDADWAAQFAQYRDSPEFRLVHPSMTLAEFKPIFWWEYSHRLLGRVAALVFAGPLIWFAATGRIDRRLGGRLAGILALGALQGALGWYMVASGLVDDPRVSPLRLAAHLGMALLLIALLLWSAWSVRSARQRRQQPPAALPALAAATVLLMALSGALVAGTHAGLVFNSFPLMDGQLIPMDLLRVQDPDAGLLGNLAAVQFLHRVLAVLVVIVVGALCWRLRAGAPAIGRATPLLLAGALTLQVSLGIATLLSGVALPLAAAHQAGAVLLFGATLWAAFQWRRAPRSTRPS
jgi:cytochrome c oxidase assembly protein subunit 15